MVKHLAVIVILILSVTGCYDRFYGPKLVNVLDSEVDIKISYSDGRVISYDAWPPCRATFFGKGDNTEDVIQEIEISKEERILYRLDANRVSQLLEKEMDYNGYSVWSINQEGIQFVTDSDPQECRIE